MTTKVGINGFGRIGRLAFRRIAETSKDLEVVAINDLTSPAMLAHLLKYDTAHGQFDGEVSATDNALIVNGKEIPVYAEADAKNIPWVKNDGVDLVLESTGFYTSKEKASAHLEAGAKRVLVSAPAGDMTTTTMQSQLMTRLFLLLHVQQTAWHHLQRLLTMHLVSKLVQ